MFCRINTMVSRPILHLQPDEPAAAPIVPPKLRPALPPKQMIDKSREDLAQIDLKFKSSLVELRSRSGCKNQFHISWQMKTTIPNELYREI